MAAFPVRAADTAGAGGALTVALAVRVGPDGALAAAAVAVAVGRADGDAPPPVSTPRLALRGDSTSSSNQTKSATQ